MMPPDLYHKIQNEIIETAQRCGRNPNEITLVAVTKGHSWQQAQFLYNAGCRNFGESRIQEALPKIEDAPQDILWHFVGSLQKNKVRKAIGKFALIHSVDNFELAHKISECSLEVNTISSILLQVNTSREATKQGLSEEEWLPLFDNVTQLPGIKLEGLMTMAPLTENEKVIRNCFSRLRMFRDKLRMLSGQKAILTHLSMGMSHDFRIAIAEGATLLRIGSAIFERCRLKAEG